MNFFVHQWLGEKTAKEIVESTIEYNQQKKEKEMLKKFEEAKEEIEQKTIINSIKSMLKNKGSYEFISKVSSKTIDEIKEIEKSMID